MEFRATGTYLTESPLRETRSWTSFAAISSDGIPVEVRVLHAEEPTNALLERRLNILQSVQSPGILAPREWQQRPTASFVVLDRVSKLTPTESSSLTTVQLFAKMREVFSGLSELHRKGLVAGRISPDDISRRENGAWSLDVMACWTERAHHDDPEEDVRQLSECCLQLYSSLTAAASSELRALLIPDPATMLNRILTASLIADRLPNEQSEPLGPRTVGAVVLSPKPVLLTTQSVALVRSSLCAIGKGALAGEGESANEHFGAALILSEDVEVIGAGDGDLSAGAEGAGPVVATEPDGTGGSGGGAGAGGEEAVSSGGAGEGDLGVGGGGQGSGEGEGSKSREEARAGHGFSPNGHEVAKGHIAPMA